MKVVLFCGGMGMRIREYSDTIPKPMVPVGSRPILWNIMRYYAHFGHRDFILCLGHQGEVIKEYFLNYRETHTNDFVLRGGGEHVELLSRDIHDWSITFVDTGLRSNIGMRLKAVQKFVQDDEMFLANYTDGLTDLPLDRVVGEFEKSKAVAGFVSVKPSQSFDIVRMDPSNGTVHDLEHVTKAGVWVNAGFFTFRRQIFDYMHEGEELVYEPFRRLISEKKIISHAYPGFFLAMDTFKEKMLIDDMHLRGDRPWEVWKKGEADAR